MAVAQGFAVIAFSSFDRTGARCWSVDSKCLTLLFRITLSHFSQGQRSCASNDLSRINAALHHVLTSNLWGALPLFALGASSGGSFVSAFANRFQLSGAAVYISPGIEKEVAAAHGPTFSNKDLSNASIVFPPTVFVFMPRDTRWASEENIAASQLLLGHKGVETEVFRVQPTGIGPLTLWQRVHNVSKPLSRYGHLLFLFVVSP